jgi:hypothetical protein
MGEFSFVEVLLWTFWFMVWFAAIWLIIAIVADIFRDSSLSGLGKAMWTIFLVVLPWLGALIYMIVRGRSMNQRALEQAQRQEAQVREYVRTVAAPEPTSTADQLATLVDLRDRGALSEAEFAQAKGKLLNGGSTLGTIPQTV